MVSGCNQGRGTKHLPRLRPKTLSSFYLWFLFVSESGVIRVGNMLTYFPQVYLGTLALNLPALLVLTNVRSLGFLTTFVLLARDTKIRPTEMSWILIKVFFG